MPDSGGGDGQAGGEIGGDGGLGRGGWGGGGPAPHQTVTSSTAASPAHPLPAVPMTHRQSVSGCTLEALWVGAQEGGGLGARMCVGRVGPLVAPRVYLKLKLGE